MKIEQSNIDKVRSRPRFKVESTFSPAENMEKIKHHFYANPEKYEGNINPDTASVCIRTTEIAPWKPHLELRTEQEDGKTYLRGTFGPNASIWTLFIFGYFILSILAMVFFTLWFVGLRLGQEGYSWGLFAGIATLLLIAGMYIAARYGQKKAAPEIDQLREFVIDAFSER